MRTLYTLLSLLATGTTIICQTPEEKNTTICWDISYSMINRNTEEDFTLLEKVFAKNKNQKVQVLFFNLKIEEKEYDVVDGNWQMLKNDLSQVIYDGANRVTDLEKRIKYRNAYIFTDGIGFMDGKVLSLPKGSYLINSNPNRNKDFLNRTTLITKSRLIDRAALVSKKVTDQKESKKIFEGTVYLDNTPAPNIKLAVKGSPLSVISDEEGRFSVAASPGDSLLAISSGNRAFKSVKIGFGSEMKIFLNSNMVTLDEVILVEERLEIETKTTAYGNQNIDAVGYAVQSISDEDISSVSTDVSNAVRGKFSGVRLKPGEDDLSNVIMRPSNSILGSNYGLIVVDGVPLPRAQSGAAGRGTIGQSSQNTSFLDPENIEDITVLKGLAATNRYGSLGSNGVLLITTKTAASGKKGGAKRDLARLTDNIYNEQVKTNTHVSKSQYIIDLQNSKDVNEAYKIYAQQREVVDLKYEYFIDVYDYFKVRNPDFARAIISNVLEFDRPSYSALRSMKFKMEKEGFDEMVLEVAKKAQQLYPDKIQTYFDLSMANKKVGNNQMAFDQLLGIADGSINSRLNFSGLKKIVEDEIKGLVQLRPGQLDISKAPEAYSKKVFYDARIIFEWNNEDSEFEIQFVNPSKRFFKWEHTDLADRSRIQDELQNGYASEQFEIIGDGSMGQWLINVNYLGNRTVNNNIRTFVKAIVQYDFGKPEQRNEEYLIRLDKKGTEVDFLKLSIQ